MWDIHECPLPTVRVLHPMTHNTWDEGRYTTYEICIQTHHKAFSLHHSCVRRRFSEFVWLRKQLKSHHVSRTPPSLPPKKFFVARFGDEFIKERQEGLEKFINRLIKEPLYLSDSVLHLFLQTNLHVRQLEHFVEGDLSDDFIHQLWQSGGKTQSPESQANPAQQCLPVNEESRDEIEAPGVDSEATYNFSDISESTSDDSPSSINQSDQEDRSCQGNESLDSGLNLSHVAESPELRGIFPRELTTLPPFSINNQGNLLSD